MKFVIYSPDYTRHCGGIKALHNLAWELQLRGQEVKIFANVGNPSKPVPLTKDSVDQDSIAVYPEIYPENPLNLKKVVRWVLAPIDKSWIEIQKVKGDMICVWNNHWGEGLHLNVNIINFDLFNLNDIGDRTLILTYKAPRIPGDIEITDYYPDTHEELARLEKHAKYLRSGDNGTAVVAEALLCGCPVLYTNPDPTIVYPTGKSGIAFSIEELDEAERTVNQYGELYRKHCEAGYILIDNFIKECENFWNK